ncbi:hypothetical protein, partial [Methylobacterium sp. E-046]|uniref:hypothetical protein n=1 Tax=Methylobacterium sp. E-046 TaxID=2836576 RepID=UPI001FBA0755
ANMREDRLRAGTSNVGLDVREVVEDQSDRSLVDPVVLRSSTRSPEWPTNLTLTAMFSSISCSGFGLPISLMSAFRAHVAGTALPLHFRRFGSA